MSVSESSSSQNIFRPGVTYDSHQLNEIAERYAEHYPDFIFNPISDSSATERILAKREEWRTLGTTVVFTSGVYDLLHQDHKGYLLHTKLTGAAFHYQQHYAYGHSTWDDLTSEEKRVYSDTFIKNEELKLIVSVDGDNSVANRKSGVETKASSPRPITGWLTRASSVVDVTYPFRTANGWDRRPVADAVTAHGPEDFDATSPHGSIINLACALQPDVWAIYEESEDILSDAPLVPALGAVALSCIPIQEGITYFSDSFLGRFSTTAILRRAKGEA
ncbi:hypothetical protein H0X10_03780 [Candidatus Saccharibacteria bacterium]|nr:hypothetical protein [Candidatus Saccharibacteria bacterium]